MRRGAPGRRAYVVGSLPDLTSMASRAEAERALLDDVLAPSTRRAAEAKWRTVRRMVAHWGLEPLPVTHEVIIALGSALKAGGYRTAESYLGLLRSKAERAGQVLTPDLLRLLRDALRSCLRGRGPALRPLPLPLQRLGELPVGDDPWVSSGPLGPRNLIVAGAGFLLREMELSTTRALHVEIVPDAARVEVIKWTLPASKNDPRAVGTTRCHACICGKNSPKTHCPVHSLLDQMWTLERAFPERFDQNGELPRFVAPILVEIGRGCYKGESH